MFSGISLKQACSLYSTTYSEGRSLYVGPDDPNGLARSASLSVNGSILNIDEKGNSGEEDAMETYKIINKNTLRALKTEVTSHRGGKKPFPMIDGTMMRRCPTLEQPSSVSDTVSGTAIDDADRACRSSKKQRDFAARAIRASGYDCASADSVCPYVFSEGFSVACNKYRYSFEIENHGGRWSVVAK